MAKIGNILKDRKKTTSNTKTDKQGDKPQIKRTPIEFYLEDYEFYKKFMFYMKKQSPTLECTHKDAQKYIMELIRDKYPEIDQI